MSRHAVIGTALVALLCGVAAMPQSREPLPSVRALAVPGEFVWHDLVTDDASACRAFYGALFGWTFEAGDGIDPGYTIIKHDGVPIGGIVLPDPKAGQPLHRSVARLRRRPGPGRLGGRIHAAGRAGDPGPAQRA